MILSYVSSVLDKHILPLGFGTSVYLIVASIEFRLCSLISPNLCKSVTALVSLWCLHLTRNTKPILIKNIAFHLSLRQTKPHSSYTGHTNAITVRQVLFVL
jgi:hypothetical protein